MGNELNEIGIGLSHVPTVQAGKYTISANLENELNKGNSQKIEFHVEGYDYLIPQNEVLAVYPINEGKGNYAGVFPHVQFRRSTLPWEYECSFNGERSPYLFLVVVKEEEFQQKKVEIVESNTNDLWESLESEQKTITILKFEEGSEITPPLSLISSLAHVRVQKHQEITALNLPEETSIIISHRMIEPNTKYRAFVCYYIEENNGKFKMVSKSETKTSLCLVLNEWSFESIGTALYQIDAKKIKNHPDFKDFDGVRDSEVVDYDRLKNIIKSNKENPSYGTLFRLIEENEKFLDERKARFDRFKLNRIDENAVDSSTEGGEKKLVEIKKENDTVKHEFEEKEKEFEKKNNHILEYLEYNGKTLKGLLHELDIKAFKTDLLAKNEAANQLFDIAKVPLAHQLKGGGKMISWYQGPFVNRNYNFDLEEFLKNNGNNFYKGKYLPDHADHLVLFNEDTKMYDMTYASAWQLGRLMIMNDNKVLQELKKWKYDLSLNQLIEEQNNTTHLMQLSANDSVHQVPPALCNYVAGFLKFENFPLYYLFPHTDLSTEESCKYFKIDNAWLLAFLFGIFSAGPTLGTSNFKHLVLDNPVISEIFDYKEAYYGIVLQSQMIKNWPHLIIELNNSFDFKYVTSINSSLRLYVANKNFDEIQMYLKNENAHFGIEYPESLDVETFIDKKENKYSINGHTILQDKLPFELLYKQPHVNFKITKAESEKRTKRNKI